jgi:transcriptional regulator with XRE-family HTH domain
VSNSDDGFAQSLVDRRRSFGINQEELATEAGVHSSVIAAIESGTIKSADKIVRQKIARAFDHFAAIAVNAQNDEESLKAGRDVYRHETMVREYENTRVFQDDAPRMATQGWTVTTTSEVRPNSTAIHWLTLGIAWLLFRPQPVLLVTYQRTVNLKASQR